MPKEEEKKNGLFEHSTNTYDYLKDKPTEQFKPKQGLRNYVSNGFYRRPAHKIKVFEEGR